MPSPVVMRFRLVAVVLALGLLLVGARLYQVQVLQAKEFLAQGYVDTATLAMMNRLLKLGVLKAGQEGRVAVDQKALARVIKSPAKQKRVKRYAARAWLKPGEKSFDHRLFRVMSTRRLAGTTRVLRGRILDREGRPLAVSYLSPATHLPYRHYTLGPQAAGLLGFASPIYGKRGLEAALDELLSRPDPGKPAAKAGPGRASIAPGVDAVLTVDATMQVAAAEALSERRGAVVILDAATGAILAAAGNPAFDPNQKDPAAWHTARRRHQGRLFRHPAWERLYPPGSTFKLVVAAAQLASGQPAPHMFCGKRDRRLDISDIHPSGQTDLDRAVIKSVNLYFARLGVALGPAVLAMAERFGFNRPADLLPQLSQATLPTAAPLAFARWRYAHLAAANGGQVSRRLVRFKTWRRDFKLVAQGSIGQNLVSATPLAMAQVAQTIANHGVRQPAWLLKGYRDPEEHGRYRELDPPKGARVIEPEASARLAGLMARVMLEGTGRSAPKLVKDGRPWPVAGKTGTAETGRKGEKPHAWFVGFAPADNPRLAIAVILENGGRGGRRAAPLGARILAAVGGASVVEPPKKAKRKEQED